MKTKLQIPPCPDPRLYTLVQTRRKAYWRLKRGTIKPAVLNSALQQNAAMAKITAPVVQALRNALFPYLQKLQCGYTWIKIRSLLSAGLSANGLPGFQSLAGIELHPPYPLNLLLVSSYQVAINEATIQLDCSNATVKRHNQLVTDFILEAILVIADVDSEEQFEVQHQVSPVYAVEELPAPAVNFHFMLPASGYWMLLLKVSCFEGAEAAIHPRHYGCRIVAGG